MTLIQCKQVDIGYTQKAAVLQQIDFAVAAGECHQICGETGSGKSSLLMLLADLHSGPFSGEVARQSHLKVGLVMQDPNVQFIRQRVGAEVAFALENMAVPTSEMPPLVEQALHRVGLNVRLDAEVDSLSLGQKYRLMLASQLVNHPQVLLLDEPSAQLDQPGIGELTEILLGLLSSGVAIVIVEHNLRAFQKITTHRWLINQTRVQRFSHCEAKTQSLFAANDDDNQGGSNQIAARLHASHQPHRNKQTSTQALPKLEHPVNQPVALQSPPFDLGFKRLKPLFSSHDELTLVAGERALLVGDNGSGKSTLLKAIAGIQSGLVETPIKVFGQKPQLGVFGAQLGLLLQSPNRQLFELSVIQELEFGLRRFSLPLSYGSDILVQMGLEHLAERSPHQLSYGQQHLIALASVICLRPKLLLLDDPFAGLDEGYRQMVYELITSLAQQGGAVLIASHKPWPDAPIDRYWQLVDGVLKSTHIAAGFNYEH